MTHSGTRERTDYSPNYLQKAGWLGRLLVSLDRCQGGIGPVLATALVASVADAKGFRSARNFSAWIGLVPKQRSS
jgi:hypothetical protein